MKGWRTLIFAAVLALAGVIEQFDWSTVVPEGWTGLAMIGVAAVVAYLRKISTTPILTSE